MKEKKEEVKGMESKMFKKILASALAVTMLTGIVPANVMQVEAKKDKIEVLAEDESSNSEVVDAAVIFSDLHTSKTKYKQSEVNALFSELKDTNLKFTSVTSAGDAFSVNEDNASKSENRPYTGLTKTINDSIRVALGDAEIPINYVWSDHDRYAVKEDGKTLLDKASGIVYGAGEDGTPGTEDDGNYYIYALSMGDLSSNDRYRAGFGENRAQNGFTDSVDTAIANFLADAENMHKDRPLLIASHQPLLANRGDNGYANEWCDAINTVADKMDVAFFHGHNHNYDKDSDYYYAKGSEMPVAQSNNDKTGVKTKINFTHMCAGYMEPSSTGSTSSTTREGVAVVATIYEDYINYTAYDADGIYDSNEKYMLNVDVERDFAADAPAETPEGEIPDNAVLTDLEITTLPSITKYFVNDKLDITGMVVEAAYSDGENTVTKELVDEYELSYDLSEAGVQEVVLSYTYGDVTLTDTFEIMVGHKSFLPEVTGANVNLVFADPGVTEVKVEENTDSELIKTAVGTLLENYVSYDFKLEGYTEGSVVTVTLPLPEGVTNPVVYHVSDSGVATRVQNVTVNEDGTITFDAKAFSSYAVGNGAEIKIDITHDTDEDGEFETVDKTIVIKWVTNETTYQLDCKGILGKGEQASEFTPAITWSTNKTNLATVDENGLVTFKQDNGTVQITATYNYGDGNVLTDSVTFSISVGEYIVPGDGTDAFPEYPNEGSIRFDKTAASVGVFSETGIAEMELSMTGVPYAKNNTIDVVLMLDRSNSMTDARIKATMLAVNAFINTLVKNEDGSFTGNRIFVGDFQGGNPEYLNTSGNRKTHHFRINQYTTNEQQYIESSVMEDPANKSSISEKIGYQVIDSDEELETLIGENGKITKYFKRQTTGTPPYGTEYAQSLEMCYELLDASKEDGHKQFCVFMSDGIPNVYQYGADENDKTESSTQMSNMFNKENTNTKEYDNRGVNYHYEYWSSLMKQNDVTVYSIGLGLRGTNSSLGNNVSAENCEKVANILLNDISGPAGEQEKNRDTGKALSKMGKYFFSVAAGAGDETSAVVENMKKVFANISQQILEAAKDVRVIDKIADKYTMVFEAPNAVVGANLPEGQRFYIEAKEYNLTPEDKNNDGVIDDYKRGDPTSLLKVYLGMEDDEYFAAKEDGTHHDTPTFTQKALGKKFYWSTEKPQVEDKDLIEVEGVKLDADGNLVKDADDNVVKTTYYFVSTGDGNYNMVSGAFASGTLSSTNIIDDEKVDNPETPDVDERVIGQSKTSQNLIIATPYFVYNAETRMLVWTAEKLSTKELALTYFLYLETSGGFVGNLAEENNKPVVVTPEGTYETNDYAHLDYTNFQGVECEQTFPVPQMTWNGAQVSYVFYLVNDKGIPVNRAGRPIPFSEAVYVTDVYNYSVTWNQENAEGKLEASRIAKDLVPDVYELYDNDARYDIYVYEDEKGTNRDNHFIISGTKDVNTTYVFNTKADAIKYTNLGTYDAVANNNVTDVHTGFDFANTTVAFAVLWSATLVEDVVVIDYGLPVDINVSANDNVTGKVIGLEPYNSGKFIGIEPNSGIVPPRLLFTKKLDQRSGLQYGDAEMINDSHVRYTPKTMNISDAEKFHYVTELQYYESNGTYVTARLYTDVTVIPATTIYFEDSFVSFNDGGTTQTGLTDADTPNGKWVTEGSALTGVTQQQDRPGPDKISAVLDADNVYGYDKAYTDCTQYSLGSAKKVTVSAYNNPKAKFNAAEAEGGSWPTAAFTFTGTGFDIISLTSRETGLIKVKVENKETGKVYNWTVDTYYGYTYDAEEDKWEASTETTDNALYQIPVIKSDKSMPYGTYDVTITPTYSSTFDHVGDGSYDFYLDAIRIYDPANDGEGKVDEEGNADTTIEDAYVADKEGWPAYTEVRNMLIKATDFYTWQDVAVVDETEEGGAEDTEPVRRKNGIIFIDGISGLDDLTEKAISDYTSFGPNNEVYLAPDQAIAFNLNTGDAKVASVQLAVKGVNGEVDYKIYDAGKNESAVKAKTLNTATDMYEDITGLKGKTVIIANTSEEEGRILSITNLKVTFTEKPNSELDLTDLIIVVPEIEEQVVLSLRSAIGKKPAPAPEKPEVDNEDNTDNNETPKEEGGNTSLEEVMSPVAKSILEDIMDTINWIKNFFRR